MAYSNDNDSGPFANGNFNGIDSAFTNVQEIAAHEHNVLYKAMRYGRWYLLKGIAPRYNADEAHRQMLIKEFDTMMKLLHPGIVQAVSLDDVPNVGMCIVMEYIEGKTLEQWLEQTDDGKKCRAMFMQILDAVEYIHQQGVVHRDLKPSNIMISRVGNQVKIIDFGFADADSNSIFKHAAGTQGYISPEQAAGGEPDVRNDIYSLGAILEKMIPPVSRRYRKVMNCCKGPIDKRYNSVAQLRDAMSHINAIRNWKLFAAVMALLATVSVMLFLLIGNHKTAQSSQAPTQSLPADTAFYISNQSDTLTPTATPQEIQEKKETETIEPPLATATPTPTPSDSRQQAINQAIEEGERKLKAFFPSKELKQNLDTLSDPKYLDLELVYGGFDFINSYTESLKPRFSDKEISVIYQSLVLTNGRIIQDINKRIDRIK